MYTFLCLLSWKLKLFLFFFFIFCQIVLLFCQFYVLFVLWCGTLRSSVLTNFFFHLLFKIVVVMFSGWVSLQLYCFYTCIFTQFSLTQNYFVLLFSVFFSFLFCCWSPSHFYLYTLLAVTSHILLIIIYLTFFFTSAMFVSLLSIFALSFARSFSCSLAL